MSQVSLSLTHPVVSAMSQLQASSPTHPSWCRTQRVRDIRRRGPVCPRRGIRQKHPARVKKPPYTTVIPAKAGIHFFEEKESHPLGLVAKVLEFVLLVF